MHKTLLSVGVMALFGAAFVTPAPAQMCGAGQQAQMSSSGGMMCMGTPAQATPDPMAAPGTGKPQASGMCVCCRNMAMMKGGGTMGGHKDTGMEMPGMK